ncbi:hypothetical protein [Austwickia chelonae]|uniref:hypothetical protein n=1 Tax=Austwickia chelonae TaxID=100225 RepID=UPI0013C2E09B|nr:hypothetical protein [Austwickia chelonae]
MEQHRPEIRRVGRRRVRTDEVSGVVPRQDPTSDDRPEPSASLGGIAAARAKTGEGGAPLSARDRWILEQRPPHWG